MFKVKVKGKGFNGIRAGVRFSMGVGEFEDEKLIPVFERLGYEIVKPEPVEKEEKPKAPKKKAPAKKQAPKKETSKAKGE